MEEKKQQQKCNEMINRYEKKQVLAANTYTNEHAHTHTP